VVRRHRRYSHRSELETDEVERTEASVSNRKPVGGVRKKRNNSGRGSPGSAFKRMGARRMEAKGIFKGGGGLKATRKGKKCFSS